MTSNSLPPLVQVRKPSEVEDPININVNRRLAYAFVRLIYPTRMTPNHVTYLATLVGLIAAGFWFVGTPFAMLMGGILLWTSAILDGADGVLARARNSHSQFGRALDGFMDLVVAVASIAAGFFHVWQQHPGVWLFWAGIPLLLTSGAHLLCYDFYKESFLRFTNPDNKDNESFAQVDAVFQTMKTHTPWYLRMHLSYLRGAVQNENRFVALTNPAAAREGLRYTVNSETAEIYRRYNLGPMSIWRWLGLAPHTYLISIFGMFDRLDLYLWFRLIVFNFFFLVALLWQRFASERTLRDLTAVNAAPIPLT